jgi:hypothetical protein
MQARVAASTASWKLAFAHHPRWTSGDHQLDNGYLNTITSISGPGMYELLEGIYCGVDIFLTGHDHNREYIGAGQDPACPNTHFIISGAGAKTRESAAAKVQNSEYYDEAIEGFFYLTFKANEVLIESYDMSSAFVTSGDPADCPAAGAAAPAFSKTITK